ncbi:acidic leucine-rich nuclear phosphoprotein 32 family member A-like [Raphanus sativus]|nr:acidic leucine-rich nuclear phosphoprotein 32 family member A-like [Raphanus sativus]
MVKKAKKANGKGSTKSKTAQSVRARNPIVEEVSNPIPVPEPAVHSVSVSDGSESEGMSASSQIIDSMLLPTVDEEIMLVRIIDVEEEYEREGGLSDTWNYWLNVKGKKIWWKEMYELDIAARKFSKERKKGKGKVAEASSSNADLESTLKGFEEEILNSLAIGFAGFKVQVDTKLEAMDTRLSGMEKTQRYLKRKVRKIDKRLTSLESKGNEDGEYMDFDYGGSMNYDRPEKTGEKGAEEEAEDDGDKENSEKVAGDFEEEDEDDDIEQEAERRRVEADEAWRRLPPESDEDVEEDRDSEEVSEESPKTPHVEKEKEAEKGYEESLKAPRGRTKAAAAKKYKSIPLSEWIHS